MARRWAFYLAGRGRRLLLRCRRRRLSRSHQDQWEWATVEGIILIKNLIFLLLKVFEYNGEGNFGELALLYNQPRAATVQVEDEHWAVIYIEQPYILSSHIYWAAIIYSAMVCVACPWHQLAGNKWGETLENGSADVQKDCSQKRFPGEEKEFSHVKPSLHIFVFQKRKMYESFLSSVSLLKHLNVSTSSFIFLRDSSWMKSLSSLRVQLSTIKSVYILDWKLVSWISNLSACLVVTKSAYFSM